MVSLSIFLQFRLPGLSRVETNSLLIGFVLGMLTMLALNRLKPIVARWGQVLRRRMRQLQVRLRATIETRYREEVTAYSERYFLAAEKARLPDIFVSPRLRSPEFSYELEDLATTRWQDIALLWPETAAGVALPPAPSVTVRQLLLNAHRVGVAGAPGAGKSTLLAYAANLCVTAEPDSSDAHLAEKMPLLVHLAELDLATPATPLLPLIQALQNQAGVRNRVSIESYFEEQLAANNVLLLIDGWDEAGKGEQGEAVNWLRQLFEIEPDLRVIMAVPSTGYGPLLGLDFLVTDILPWRVGQMTDLGNRWGQALSKPSRPVLNRYWQPGQPQLLTSLKLWLHLDAANTTGREVDLMEASLRPYLTTSEKDPGWLAPAMRDFWEHICLRLLIDGMVSFDRTLINELSETIIADYEIEDRGASGRLYQTLVDSPLFVVWPNDRVGTRSPVWRDYLAAGQLAQLKDKETLLHHLDDDRWQGVRRFYAGRTGARALAEYLLESASPRQRQSFLFEVAGWIPELPESDEAWARQVLTRLGRLVVQPGMPLALRQRAILAVTQTGQRGVLAFLKKMLQLQDESLRFTVIACLVRLEPETALQLLDQILADRKQKAVRPAVANSLAWLVHPATESPLLEMLIGKDEQLSQLVAEHLALNGGEGWKILREAINEEDFEVRRAATYGLALIDEPWAKDTLVHIVRHEEEWIVKAAATAALDALEKQHEPQPWAQVTVGDQPWLIRWAASQGRSVPAGQAAMPVLLEVLAKAETPQMRIAAANSLGRMGLPSANKALQAAAQSDDLAIRDAAYSALAMINRAHPV